MAELILLKTFLLLVVPVTLTFGYSNETALRALLQTGYDRYTRPEIPTNVTITFSLRSLKHLDIISESMKATGLFSLVWYDSRLAWTPASFGNITSIDVNWVWRPEFIIGNSIDDIPAIGYDDDETRMTVFSSGEVLWGVYFVTETSCRIDTSDFPHDEQTCGIEMVLLNQNYETNTVITLPYTEVDRTFYLENGEWEWTGSMYQPIVYTLCCPTLKVMALNFMMTFNRRQSFYIVNILLPIILLSFCVPWAFYINTDSGDRSGFALTMLLSYFVFLGVVSELIPSTSLNVPVLAEYLLTVLLLCSLALICVTIQVKLYFVETSPPLMARKVYRVVRYMLEFRCCGKKHVTSVRPVTAMSSKQPLPEDDEMAVTSRSSIDLEEDITWKCITLACDRFLFYLYNLAVLVANMALLIALYK